MNIGGDMPGLTIWPSGGSTVARKAKRDTTSCTGFTTASQESSYSNSVQVSNIVDCTNSADNGCTITEGEQHTESVSTSFSTTAGFEVEGLSLGATFGTEYTDSEASSLQEGFTIDAGQKGYLSAFSTATLFKGTFTGCDDGDQDGEVLAIKENGFTYSVIYTDA
ncbi:hypothetical protein GGR57DRAFT_487258 [Xylariaceae sp. FL1272]|nr:hypothetical protein GGR57DRAFT_487258 [Xylariaceae sp. FL1272]